jgi:hypothetical protein
MTHELISPRTGKPKQNQLGKSKKALELRAKKIATAMLDGATQEQALISAGYSMQTAKTQSTAILGNPVIQAAFSEILEKAGLSDEYIASKHKELIDAEKLVSIRTEGEGIIEVTVPDYAARARALDMYYRVRRLYVEQKEVSGKDGGPIQIEKLESMTNEELLAIIARGRRERGEDEDTARVTNY